MSRPRVLFLSSWPIGAYGEGAVSFIYEQIRALSQDVSPLYLQPQFVDLVEWSRRLLLRKTSEPITDLWNGDVPAVRVYVPRLPPWLTKRSLLEDVRQAGVRLARHVLTTFGRPDLVHSHVVLPAGLLGSSVSSALGIPLLVQEHSAPFEMHLDTEEKRGCVLKVFDSAARIAPVGDDLASRIIGLGVPPSKLTKLPEMVSTDRFTPRPYPTERSPLRIVSVGSLEARKGFDVLIEAASILQKSGHSVHLSIVGGGELGPKLNQMAQTLELGPNVTFHGHLTRSLTATVIAESHIYVCASVRETFGIAPAEALAIGRPVVTTACGGPEEYVGEEDGCIVRGREPAALAEAILYLADRLESFEPSALHDRIDRRFGPEQFRHRVRELYNHVRDPSRPDESLRSLAVT